MRLGNKKVRWCRVQLWEQNEAAVCTVKRNEPLDVLPREEAGGAGMCRGMMLNSPSASELLRGLPQCACPHFLPKSTQSVSLGLSIFINNSPDDASGKPC